MNPDMPVFRGDDTARRADVLCREVDDLTCALIALRRLVADMTSPPRRFAAIETEIR